MKAYRFVIAEQMRLMGKDASIVFEPTGRNTAPALTLAALAANGGATDPILLVMPADHVITDAPAFQSIVRSGAELADQGVLVTFCITPDYPETGYGYIEAEPAYGDGKARQIACFVEKPDLAMAQAYLDSGGYLWNSGLFMMRASVWLSTIVTCRPDIMAACRTEWDLLSIDGGACGWARRYLKNVRRTRSTTP